MVMSSGSDAPHDAVRDAPVLVEVPAMATTVQKPADVARVVRKSGRTNVDAADVRKYVREHAVELIGQEWPTDRTAHLYSPDLAADIAAAMIAGAPDGAVLDRKRPTT
jgi:hypothetical protein